MSTRATLAIALAMVGNIAFAQDIFVYSPDEKSGLHVATRQDSTWTDIGQLCSSDYAQWGAEKKMYSPWVVRAKDGTWRAVWQLNKTAPAFAIAYSDDLVTWRPQDYPKMSAQGCFEPYAVEAGDHIDVYFDSPRGPQKTTLSYDFRKWGKETPTDKYSKRKRDHAKVGGKEYAGQTFRLGKTEYDKLTSFHKSQNENAKKWQETLLDDKAEDFGNGTVRANLSVDVAGNKRISDKLIGIFFEDISYAADGGLYAEMVQNRDFEYNGEGKVKKGEKPWDATTAWTSDGEVKVDTAGALSQENPHYAILKKDKLTNSGWDGMRFDASAEYYFTMFGKTIDGKANNIEVRLLDGDKVVGNGHVKVKSKKWKQYEIVIKATSSTRDGRLELVPNGIGTVAIDIISLFPKDTYMGRRNGLRKDLAEAIAALHPRFVRFPGGCMSHGQGIDNIYKWSETVGPIERRKPQPNIWHYHQTRGLGFYEFFQWCEDMGAEPLPVLAAGVPCQNSAPDASGMGGQQDGIPMEQMEDYCNEILSLIEWANGDPKTSEWAKMRAEAGHPEPFNLKYLGIGNEDLISTVFEERMIMIAKAVKEKYPDIVICGTAGPFHTPSSDYIEGWKFAKEHSETIGLVDEHYYESPGWYLNNQDYYDNYDRNAPKVYLGEYSARAKGGRSTVESALCEAIHLCNIERNGDVVLMTSYAPLLCNTFHTNWNPDMIYFRGSGDISLTPSYETQRLFGTYSGTVYVPSTIEGDEKVRHRTAASIVVDKEGMTTLKVVNAMPVALELSVQGFTEGQTFAYEGFSGSPADRSVKSEKGTENVSGEGTIIIPAYSFRTYILFNGFKKDK